MTPDELRELVHQNDELYDCVYDIVCEDWSELGTEINYQLLINFINAYEAARKPKRWKVVFSVEKFNKCTGTDYGNIDLDGKEIDLKNPFHEGYHFVNDDTHYALLDWCNIVPDED
jgi:hypothetical protein